MSQAGIQLGPGCIGGWNPLPEPKIKAFIWGEPDDYREEHWEDDGDVDDCICA